MKYILLNDNGEITQILNDQVEGSLPVSDIVATKVYNARPVKVPQRQLPLPDDYYILVDGEPTKKKRETSEGDSVTPDFPILGFSGYDEAEVLDSVVLETAKLVVLEKQALELVYEASDVDEIIKPETELVEELSQSLTLKDAKGAAKKRQGKKKVRKPRKKVRPNKPQDKPDEGKDQEPKVKQNQGKAKGKAD